MGSKSNLTPPEGLIIDLVTPLTGAGELDRVGLARLLARVAPAADGLLAGSPLAGESLELPLEVRRHLLGEVLETLAGSKPLFFCITASSTGETRELAEAVQAECRRRKYPGPVFLADLPLWYRSNRGLPQAYEDLLAGSPHPLALLNLPQVIGRRAPVFKRLNIRTHVFKRLAALPGILALIYQGEMRRFLNYSHAAQTRAGFAFYEADEVRFLTRPGTKGVISVGAQIFPDPWQRVVRACLHPEELAEGPERYAILELGQQLLRLAQACQAAPAALVKGALAAEGVLAGAALAPGTPPAQATQLERFTDLLDSLKNF